MAQWQRTRLQCRSHKRQVQSLGQEDPLEKGIATHSSILAWEMPWTEETGGLPSTGVQRVRHDSDLAHTHAYMGEEHNLAKPINIINAYTL